MKLVDMLVGLVGPSLKGYVVKRFGKEIQFKLNDERVMSIVLNDSCVRDHYDEIVMKVIGRNGEINKVGVVFEDLFHHIEDMSHPNRITKYITYSANTGECGWYGRADDGDIKAIRQMVKDYIDMWKW